MADKTYELRFGLSDGTAVPLRFTVPQGPKGDDGVSVTKAKINENGHLIVTLSDGQEIDTGVAKGLDAFSPVVSVTQIAGGNKLSITDANGTKSFDILDGKHGDPGTSVTVKNVSESTADGGSNVVTFSDGKSLTVKNGSKGSPGDKGDKGDPPIIAVNPIDGGNRLVITGANGSKVFNVMDGKQGDPGDDGYSPTIEVEQTDNGHIVSVTDKNGTQSFTVLNGSGGGNTQVNYETQVYNKPFGDVFDNGKIVNETSAMFSDGVQKITKPLAHKPVVGKKYTVSGNKITAFETYAREFEMYGMTFIAIGNAEALSGGESTGEPFLVMVYPEELTEQTGIYAEAYNIAWVEDTSQSSFMSYYVEGPYIVRTDKINKKFLPDDVGTLVSWPDIKNKPFGEITVTELVCLPEMTVEFDPEKMEGYIVSAPENEIVTGETYTVNWNGAEYTCTAQSFDGLGVPAVVLGNLGAMTGGDDTGEPFIVVMFPAEVAAELGAYGVATALDGSATATLSIIQKKETVSKIDPIYLPAGGGGTTSWNDLTDKPFYKEEGDKFILPEITLIPTGENGEMFVTRPFAGKFIEGNTYTITWNGVEYNCNAIAYPGIGIILGNLAALGGAETGEPFVFLVLSDAMAAEEGVYAQCMPLDGSETATISIYGYSKFVKTLDPEFLPGALGLNFVVNIEGTYDLDPSEWVADKTFAETQQIIENGGIVFFRFNGKSNVNRGRITMFMAENLEDSHIFFYDFKVNGSVYEYVFNDDETFSKNIIPITPT